MFRSSVPDRKWKQLEQAIKTSVEPVESRLARIYRVATNQETDPDVEDALEMLSTDFYRDSIMAFLFSKATLMEIQTSLNISPEVIQVIEYLMFNPDEIRNKLDHIYYARKYMQNSDNEETCNLIQSALVGGPCTMQDRFALGNEDPILDTAKAAKRMLVTALNLGLVCRGNAITTEASKQALRWFDSASKLLLSYNKLTDREDDETDALVAIERRKQTYTLDEVGASSLDEILH